MHILIFGGTGFIGRHIVRELAAQGHTLRLYHRGQQSLPEPLPPNVKEINAELSSLRTYRNALRALKFDAIVHLLALRHSDAQQAIDAFAGHGPRIVVASSQDVYAPFAAFLGKQENTPSPFPLAEDGPLRTARHIYGTDDDKLLVEQAFLEFQQRLPVTLMRLPAVYGPGDTRGRFVEWLKRMEDRRPAILLEPAMANFRWTHGYVENVAHAIALAVTTPHAPGVTARMYNVSEVPPNRDAGITNGAPTIAERLHWIARAAGYKGRIVVVPRDRCPPHLLKPFHFEHDLVTTDARLRTELDYAELVPLEEALKRTVDWQRAHLPATLDPQAFDYAAEDQVIKELGIL